MSFLGPRERSQSKREAYFVQGYTLHERYGMTDSQSNEVTGPSSVKHMTPVVF